MLYPNANSIVIKRATIARQIARVCWSRELWMRHFNIEISVNR